MIEPQEVYLTNAEVEQAWKNWLYYHRGVHCEEVETRFFTYCHSLEQSFVDDMLLHEEACDKFVAASTAQRVKLLAGPHFNAAVSAYYVKHPWK